MTGLEMFACARRRLSLTRKGCAALWVSARRKPPAPWDGRAACIGCNVGARNAGQPEVPEIAAAVDAWRRVCPRCRRVSLRMIGDRLCISCYNRDREVRIGRNAKGGRVRLAARLHPVSLAVVNEEGARTMRLPSILDLSEAMIVAARKATGPLFFTLSAPRWPVEAGLAPSVGESRINAASGHPASPQAPAAAANTAALQFPQSRRLRRQSNKGER